MGFEFISDKTCPQDQIEVEKFISVKDYPSSETGKLTPVRIINLYAKSFSPCSMKPSAKLVKAVQLEADGHMTHIYVTVADGVIVKKK